MNYSPSRSGISDNQTSLGSLLIIHSGRQLLEPSGNPGTHRRAGIKSVLSILFAYTHGGGGEDMRN